MYRHVYITYIFITIYICRLRERDASVDEDREFYRRQLKSKFFYEMRKKEWIFFPQVGKFASHMETNIF